jgi:scyllo-inositol 2-dehydrogenase (NAD+)
MDLINIGVVGLGRMGRIYSRHVARSLPGARLAGVSDFMPELAAQIANEHGCRQFITAEEMLSEASIDAVVIATPTSTHSELVIAAAAAGKAVFCEKPTALTLAETDRMIAAVDEAGVPLQIGFMRRFDKGYLAAKEKIDAGLIGQPVTIRSISRDPFRTSLEFANPKKSGGILIDVSIHDVDNSQWLMGSPITRVYAQGGVLVYPELAEVGDVDNAMILANFENSGLGFIEASRNARYGYDIQCEIIGSEGALRIGYLQETPVLLLKPNSVSHDVVPYFLERFGDAYAAQLVHFVECLHQGKEPAVGVQEARSALQVCIAATRSLRQGQPVEVMGTADLSEEELDLVVRDAGMRGYADTGYP